MLIRVGLLSIIDSSVARAGLLSVIVVLVTTGLLSVIVMLE